MQWRVVIVRPVHMFDTDIAISIGHTLIFPPALSKTCLVEYEESFAIKSILVEYEESIAIKPILVEFPRKYRNQINIGRIRRKFCHQIDKNLLGSNKVLLTSR